MKAYMNWSGGKDSALSLYRAQQQQVPVQALVTTMSAAQDRITMHGVRRKLLEQQAEATGLPLRTIELPEQPGMEVYNQTMRHACEALKADGFTHSVFGDIFLEDLRQYRETQLAPTGIAPLFPIWKADSRELLKEFFTLGFQAIVICINGSHLAKSFCGRLLDESFINDLPSSVDPCGENGEFHSFVFDGPIFQKPVAYTKGDLVYKEYPAPISEKDECYRAPQPAAGFYFCDLLPAT
ncbi:MAG TPA: diphthine--ammonia ligase [Flavisolibacter sp.]|jgi:uncharacterized protein (TIGR00290 family)|nr:diphthine--ammonia ligase [Flavisolibacter sp.]